MTDKKDKELEKSMKRVITGFEDMKRKQQEKQDKKHWSPLNIPFSLHKGLSNYTKYELDAIRKQLNIKGASNLKKAELIALLETTIPEHLEKTFLLWDAERFKLLTSIASHGGYMTAPQIKATQIKYFRSNGLIYSGTFNGKKILAVPDELIQPILSFKNDLRVRATLNRNTKWIKLTHGLLYYYGTLSITQLIDMLDKYTKEPIDFNLKQYLDVVYDAHSYYGEITIDEHGFSNYLVSDPKRVKQEHEMRKNVPFYPFTKQQVLTAGEPGFVDRNKSYQQLVHHLTKNFVMSEAEADRMVEECVYATRIGESPNDILNYFSNVLEFEDLDMIHALMDQVVNLMNNTKEWFLKGYTSTELRAQNEKHLQPLPGSHSKQKASEKVVKVGRNDPCPCGSGKKYKKCCGR